MCVFILIGEVNQVFVLEVDKVNVSCWLMFHVEKKSALAPGSAHAAHRKV